MRRSVSVTDWRAGTRSVRLRLLSILLSGLFMLVITQPTLVGCCYSRLRPNQERVANG
jgi:hypothetical protein